MTEMTAAGSSLTLILLFSELITITIQFNDIIKFSGYAPETINGNTKTCFESPLNCTESCMKNELCTAIASRNETARCDLFLLVYYARVILKRIQNYTMWVKGALAD